MERIPAVICDPVLPVFAVLVVGFTLSLGRILDAKDAGSINRFVFFLAVPALTFGVLLNADFGDFQWGVVGAYLVSEFLVYAAGTWIARCVFGFRGPEALLLGMTACFSNHILFVLPIATQLYLFLRLDTGLHCRDRRGDARDLGAGSERQAGYDRRCALTVPQARFPTSPHPGNCPIAPPGDAA